MQKQGGSSLSPKEATSTRKPYQVVKEVAEEKSYFDPETGFIFTVSYISNLFGIGITKWVVIKYTLPDGTTYELPAPTDPLIKTLSVGHTINFQFQGRKFYMVIEDIDYEKETITIMIREIMS